MTLEYTEESSFDNVYNAALAYLDEKITYYDVRIPVRKCMSWAIRFVALSCLAVGAVLPIVAASNVAGVGGLTQFDLTLYGYYAVILGGLVFAADQTFLISRSWMRFVVTKMALEDIKKDFESAWAHSFHGPEQKTEPATYAGALALYDEYIEKAQQQVSSETSQWIQELNAAMTGLEKKISRHEQKLQVKFDALVKERQEEDAARKQSARPGAILVTFADSETYIGNIFLKVAGPITHEVNVAPGTMKHPIGELPAGVYAVSMLARKRKTEGGDIDVSNGDIVTLVAGGKEEVTF